MSRVVVIGSINIDTVLRVTRHPEVGETVAAISASSVPGGKGSNQAVAAAATGVEVVLVGAVGSDGDRSLRHLGSSGVDTTHVTRRDDAATGGAYVVVSDDGENSIIVTAGANASVVEPDLSGVGLRPGDIAVFQFEQPRATVLNAMRAAAAAGATVVLNPSPWRHGADEELSLADIVIVNEIEASRLAGEVDDAKLVTTLGARGARWGDVRAVSPKIDAVDTTGAGDTFSGTLAGALAVGAAREVALESAVLAASHACLSLGAQTWRVD